MLQQENRLRRMKDFDILYKEGRFVGGALVTMKYWKVDPEKYPKRGYKADDLKIGVVVSVKVSKHAVKRNRAKRQMREVIRLLLKDQKIKTGYHIAIMAKQEILTAEYADIERSMKNVLQRGGLLV